MAKSFKFVYVPVDKCAPTARNMSKPRFSDAQCDVLLTLIFPAISCSTQPMEEWEEKIVEGKEARISASSAHANAIAFEPLSWHCLQAP